VWPAGSTVRSLLLDLCDRYRAVVGQLFHVVEVPEEDWDPQYVFDKASSAAWHRAHVPSSVCR